MCEDSCFQRPTLDASTARRLVRLPVAEADRVLVVERASDEHRVVRLSEEREHPGHGVVGVRDEVLVRERERVLGVLGGEARDALGEITPEVRERLELGRVPRHVRVDLGQERLVLLAEIADRARDVHAVAREADEARLATAQPLDLVDVEGVERRLRTHLGCSSARRPCGGSRTRARAARRSSRPRGCPRTRGRSARRRSRPRRSGPASRSARTRRRRSSPTGTRGSGARPRGAGAASSPSAAARG